MKKRNIGFVIFVAYTFSASILLDQKIKVPHTNVSPEMLLSTPCDLLGIWIDDHILPVGVWAIRLRTTYDWPFGGTTPTQLPNI